MNTNRRPAGMEIEMNKASAGIPQAAPALLLQKRRTPEEVREVAQAMKKRADFLAAGFEKAGQREEANTLRSLNFESMAEGVATERIPKRALIDWSLLLQLQKSMRAKMLGARRGGGRWSFDQHHR